MLKSLTKKWDINQSPLYRHIPTKEVDKTLGVKWQKTIIRAISAEEGTEFFQDSPELSKLVEELELQE